MHVDEAMLAAVRERIGTPVELAWDGDISDAEWALATHNPRRRHDVTLFILDPAARIALIRKPHFDEGIWRPPGGGVAPGEDFVDGAVREALEETGLRVHVRRYLVDAHALFRNRGNELPWRTHIVLAETEDEQIEADDPEEIEAARWGTPEELAGPLRVRLLATGRAFWRYRVALHDAALARL
jgi:ADP-ribose pyrophosphatase YjhB (NUDIX family)